MDQMNVKITLSYDGTDYCGFQLQTGVRTIEEELEKGLLKITKVPTKLNCAGRTDSGVHAEAQVINFFTSIHIGHSSIILVSDILPYSKLQSIQHPLLQSKTHCGISFLHIK